MVLILNKKEKESSNFNTIKIYENMCVWFQNKRKGEKNQYFSFQS